MDCPRRSVMVARIGEVMDFGLMAVDASYIRAALTTAPAA